MPHPSSQCYDAAAACERLASQASTKALFAAEEIRHTMFHAASDLLSAADALLGEAADALTEAEYTNPGSKGTERAIAKAREILRICRGNVAFTHTRFTETFPPVEPVESVDDAYYANVRSEMFWDRT